MSAPVAIVKHSTFIRARRRIQIALCTLEDGIYDLLSPQDAVWLLSAALSDLEEAQMLENEDAESEQVRGLDWNAYESVAGE